MSHPEQLIFVNIQERTKMASTDSKEQIPPPEERFRSNLRGIIEVARDMSSVIGKFGMTPPINELILTIALGVVGSIPADAIIMDFIETSSEYWTNIKNREFVFLRDHCEVLFGNNEKIKPHIGKFKDLLTFAEADSFTVPVKTESGEIKNAPLSAADTKEFKAIIADMITQTWDILQACVKISIKYADQKRKPVLVTSKAEDGSTVTKRTYTEKYAPTLKIGPLAKEWGIKLE